MCGRPRGLKPAAQPPPPLTAWPTLGATLLIGASWMVFLSAMVLPALALIARCIAQGEPPTGGFAISSRQLGLFLRSVWLSGVATFLALVLSIPGAYVIGQVRRHARHGGWTLPLVTAMLVAVLLCPPMVYSFGWERLLPAHFPPELRCIGVWAFWAWPIPAMLIGGGWSRVGGRAHEAAVLVTSPGEAFLRVVVPLLLRYVGLSGLILFGLFFSDYVVPHACGLLVYSTELLVWASSSSRPIDTAWPATLSLATTVAVLVMILLLWRRCSTGHEGDGVSVARAGRGDKLILVAAGCFAISWLLPVGGLLVNVTSWRVFPEALAVYKWDLAWSLGIAAFSGVLVVGMGLGVTATSRLRNPGLVWALLFGALPGALIGESLVASYNLDRLWWVYDHWPIMAIGYVSRFGWIGVLTAALVRAGASPDLEAQARTDGASRAQVFGHISIPTSWPALLGGVAVVTALSLADVAVSTLVRPPTLNPIAHVLFEKFHRFEDDMLIALSMWLVIASVPGAIILALVGNRRERG